jgi:hypothetical protein
MRRDETDFATFKANFIDNPDGYFPVHSCFAEDDDGEPLRVFKIDMICEWRLSDGKLKFLAVPFETEEQFDAIMRYLRLTTYMLREKIHDRLEQLKFADTHEA